MIVVQALLMLGVRAEDIRFYPLDDRSVYTIRLNPEEPTTCVFPASIKAIIGANVSTRNEDNPGILLSHEAGADYFSVRPLRDNVTGALNVLMRGRIYVLAFIGAAEPDRAVVFLDEPVAGGPIRVSSDEDLRALIERAKQFDRGEPAAAGMSSRCERTEPHLTTAYRSFVVTIRSIVRFEAEDAMVFRLELQNNSDSPVPYDVHGLTIRLGREFFPAAMADASGAIPPRGKSEAHLLIVGSPTGGRANLSVRGRFTVIVPHP